MLPTQTGIWMALAQVCSAAASAPRHG
jgi:hypothetical protein